VTRFELGKRSAMVEIAESEISKIPAQAIISKEPLPPAVFADPEPPTVVEPGKEEENSALWKQYREAKDRFEKAHADDKPMLKVNLWVPVTVVKDAKLDGHRLRIFHTPRGPIMGAVTSEDTHRVFLFSPCFLDPNIQRGRVHYLPIAFAGYEFVLYKTGIGESTPQEAEIEGYPHFVERNRAGDYTFRMKAAYHHIDADYPEDSKLISADFAPRDALLGLLLTTDAREQQMVDQARQALAQQQAQRAAQQVAQPAAQQEAPAAPAAE